MFATGGRVAFDFNGFSDDFAPRTIHALDGVRHSIGSVDDA
jgi:hypothetical protein